MILSRLIRLAGTILLKMIPMTSRAGSHMRAEVTLKALILMLTMAKGPFMHMSRISLSLVM